MEYGIIAPHLDNDGASLSVVLALFEETLIDTCGGFTAHDVRGAWRGEDGEIFRDVSTVYTVATSLDIAEQLAIQLGKDARQHAIYVKLPGGNSVIINTPVYAPIG